MDSTLKGYSMIEIHQELKYENIENMQSPNDRECHLVCMHAINTTTKGCMQCSTHEYPSVRAVQRKRVI